MTFNDKIRRAREVAGLSQASLAKASHVSQRTIASYESGGAHARRSTIERLAAALHVSVKYLSDDACTNPQEGIEKDCYVEQVRELYGAKGAKEMDALLEQNRSFFAGGEIPESQKELFFQAVMEAYLACKQEAQRKYGKKKNT